MGNYSSRCQRNCFNCPICVAPMGINNINPQGDPMSGPFILACDYCQWTTLDIGIQFDRPTKLNEKITAARKEARSKQMQAYSESESAARMPKSDPDETFAALKNFMSLQISSAGSTNPLLTPGGSYNYDSPSSLARIMSLYTGLGSYGKKNTSKAPPMRESADTSEGLRIFNPQSDIEAVKILRKDGYQETTSLEQRLAQRFPTRAVDELFPVPTLLRTKRAKRCRVCRHILVKPDAKVASTRYRIRLIALNYLPYITLKPLILPSSPAMQTPAVAIDLDNLSPLKATQFLFTMKNPMFDPVKITLATPSHTPGPFSHRVTILCPQFDIGAKADAWDEALAIDIGDGSHKPLTAPKTNRPGTEGMKVAEAGKVWDQGRNWATVVVEVVCTAIDGEIREDEDVLEIPIFVRMEYEVDIEKEGMEAGAEKGGKEKRELAYWAVVGVGRVTRMVA